MNPEYKKILDMNDDELRSLLSKRSQLYMSYAVKDKNGKFSSVIDIATVIEILHELKNEIYNGD